jgi:hypothetical protein
MGERQVEQLNLARRVAVQILDAGVIGADSNQVRVTLNGHAGEQPGVGDSIYVSVYATA